MTSTAQIQDVISDLRRKMQVRSNYAPPAEPVLPVYVTPTLPPEAVPMIRQHEATNAAPAIILAMARSELWCHNCGGGGKLYIRLCKGGGPYQSPSTASVSTWFQGNERFRKGWYNILNTVVFICPVCKGAGK